MSDLENCERYADSLYGELEAEKHAHRKDNEYLLDENQRLRDALERIANLTGAPEYHVHMLRIAREALAGDAE